MVKKEVSEHREISVAEFFEKNRHLLGFSNSQKAIVTCVKEAVDNSLDAAEDGDILPEVHVKVDEIGEERLKIVFKDNAIGIDKKHIPNVFGKLLYGSKFHKLRQSRGQQGIGISAAALYSQLTTGNPIKIISKKKDGKTHFFKIRLDTRKNKPEILEDKLVPEYEFSHGTTIEMDIEAKYTRGWHSVYNYLKNVSIVNPASKILLVEPDGKKIEFPRVAKTLPKKPDSIKPHPHGVELGILMRMIRETKARTVGSFLTKEFTRVGKTSAEEICKKADIDAVDGVRFVKGKDRRPNTLKKTEMEALLKAMQETNIQNPPTDCLSPIGEDLLKRGLKTELNPDFTAVVTRSPSVYRGMPFQIEAAIAYGGNIKSATLRRYANKVPLLYKQSACVTMRSLKAIDWGRYGLKQPGDIPQGPVNFLVHMCSVWVPYTSEGKEAIADYPEIEKEIKLALQEVGRKLKRYLSKKRKKAVQAKKLKMLKAYSQEIAEPLARLSEAGTTKEMDKKIKQLLISEFGDLKNSNNNAENINSEEEENASS